MEINEETIGALAVSQADILNRIASDLGIRVSQAAAVVELTAEGSTVPFISRYRKERTGNLDEVQVRDTVHKHSSYTNLETRRIEVLQAIFGQGKLSEDLFKNINKCQTLTEIEDIYAPYKRKKKTRGMMAIEKGLEPLAEIMLVEPSETVRARAAEFLKENTEKPELSVVSVEDALQGAVDIIAERISQNPENRAAIKRLYMREGFLVVKGIDEKKKEASTYQMYWDYKEPLSSLKLHRVLAVNRGEREEELTVSLDVNEDGAVDCLLDRYMAVNEYYRTAVDESVRRLLSPAVLREIRSEATDNADGHGIHVFSENLKNLLMSPPIKGTRILGIDPGIRTGSKCAAIDETGKFLSYFLINQETKPEDSKKLVAKAIKEFSLQLIAIGNGTAGQDVARIVAETIAENSLDIKFTMVDEDGASVYSASDVAREEFPELDLTIRGAISIGRRLQDPLAELVKIDPKSIGVGLYQHDVNQKRLSETLDEVVGSVVNKVGVNINTASFSLLKYVSGINTSLAKKIVKFRDENGKINNRDQLKKISGMGEKTFEQCAGFMKIPESRNPLDNTWVHPENYALASEILPIAKTGSDPSKEQRTSLKEKYTVGDATIDDIILELKKPNLDPRDDLPKPIMQQGVLVFTDLREGMKVIGKVKNVVDFGAFIDIGIKESALIHVSEMADRFIDDPMDILKVGDVKEFVIISLDTIRKRIGLSLKSERRENTAAKPEGARKVVVVKRADSGSQTRPEPVKTSNRDDDGTSYNPFAELLKNRK